MLQRLLGSKLNHSDPLVRAKAFAADNVDPQALLEGLNNESDPTVLAVIIARADDVASLATHAEKAIESVIVTAAQQRLVQLAKKPDSADLESWTKVFNPAVTKSWPELKQLMDLLSAKHGYESLTRAALQVVATRAPQLVSQEKLQSLVLESQNPGLRQDAASLITDSQAMEACCAGVKDRDKTVYRALKSRLDAYKKTELQRCHAEDLIAECESLQDFAIVAQPENIAQAQIKWQKLNEQTSAVCDAEPELPEAIRLGQLVSALTPAIEAKLATAKQAVQQRHDLMAALVVEDVSNKALRSDRGDLPTADALCKQYQDQWVTIPDTTDFESDKFTKALQEFNTALQRQHTQELQLTRLTDLLQKFENEADTKEPDKVLSKFEKQWHELTANTTPDRVETLLERQQQLVSAWRHQSEELEKLRAANSQTIDDLLVPFSASLANGNVKLATSLHDKLRNRLSTLDLDQKVKYRVEAVLKDASPKLDEFRKWRHFGTVQARENLIGEANTLLADPPASPKILATKIKQMREAWKKLDADDGRASEKHWQLFSTACKQAYKPAKKHFNDLAKTRKENFKIKQAILQKLTELFDTTDWDDPDWGSVSEVDKLARREWQKTGAVDFKERKELDAAYLGIITKFDKHLGDQKDKEIRRRQLMTSQLREQLEADEIVSVADSAKKMQRLWRPSIQADRKTEQQLWHDFRSVCDEVFAKLKEKSQTDKQEWQADADERRALCDQLDTLITDPASVDEKLLNQSRGIMADIAKRWGNRHTIPKPVFVKLDNHYSQVRKQYKQRVNSAKEAMNQRNTSALGELFRLCEQTEHAALQEPGAVADTFESFQSRWDACHKTPCAIGKSLTKRFGIALNALQGDAQAIEKIRRQYTQNAEERLHLCLLGELIADLPTPEEFKSARMQLQVQRLKDALQGNIPGKQQELDALVERWYVIGGVSAAQSESLHKRFAAIIKASRAS